MIYFTVGPTQLYPTVPDHIYESLRLDVPSVSHRGTPFAGWYEECVANLTTLLDIPPNYHLYFISSGTEGMERIIQNTVTNHSLHLIQGAFGTRWFEIAQELKKSPFSITAEHNKAITARDIEKTAYEGVDLVCVTHNDTSTGIRVNPSLLKEVRTLYPNALIAVDAVSSVPSEPIPWAEVDCAFFGVQKGFGLPAGLGVIIINDRVLERSKDLKVNGADIGTYHNFPTLERYAQKGQTPETPNTLGVYLLSKVTADLCKRGMQSIRSTTESYVREIYTLVDGSHTFSCLITGHDRSHTTICLIVEGGSKRFITYAQKRGVAVGSGYGAQAEKQIRIALFPAHTPEQVQTLLTIMKEYK
ncbi:MAG: aminotransferase class V-fold PLP-dependent enzyme [Candidatus Roizmanbacteria bacterium]